MKNTMNNESCIGEDLEGSSRGLMNTS